MRLPCHSTSRPRREHATFCSIIGVSQTSERNAFASAGQRGVLASRDPICAEPAIAPKRRRSNASGASSGYNVLKMKTVFPRRLEAGGSIGIISPARWLDGPLLDAGCAELHRRGYRTKVHAQNYQRLHQFAGPDEVRLGAIHDLFKDPEVAVILCTKGGYGTLRYLDQLDFDLIRARPKPLVGYSDATALLVANYECAGLVGFHGPMLLTFADQHEAPSIDALMSCLTNSSPSVFDCSPDGSSRTLRVGRGQGRLIGGNLSILANLIGTRGEPDLDGAVLFLEDVDEYYYALDRLFVHLRRAGWLASLSGLIVGRMVNAKDNQIPFGIDIDEMVLDACRGTTYPILSQVPIGHVPQPMTLPVGVLAELRATDGSCILELLEAPVC